MPVHYPIRVHFDSTTTPTAQEIYNASAASTKGNDVRIVYNDATELNRTVQRFTSSQIDLWFPLAGWYAVARIRHWQLPGLLWQCVGRHPTC